MSFGYLHDEEKYEEHSNIYETLNLKNKTPRFKENKEN